MSRLHSLQYSLRQLACSRASCEAVLDAAGREVALRCEQHATSNIEQCRKLATPRTYSSLRRVRANGSNGSAAEAAGTVASASGQGSSSSLLEMSNEVPGGSKPLRKWERYYWGVGVVGISVALYWNLKQPEKTPEEIEAAKARAAELEAQRKEHIRSVLIGSNFLQGERDPLEGLGPKQIEQFMAKHGIDPADPLEGLTPEEIDAYVKQQEQQQQ